MGRGGVDTLSRRLSSSVDYSVTFRSWFVSCARFIPPIELLSASEVVIRETDSNTVPSLSFVTFQNEAHGTLTESGVLKILGKGHHPLKFECLF